MKREVLNDIAAKTRTLIEAPTCSAETKAAAERWLAAAGTGAEAEETKAYIAELEEDIMPIDSLIGFAQSEQGAAYFGAETAAGIAAHAQQIKAAGAKYIVYTDISRDGMLSGPNVDSTRELVEKSGMCIIASGGVSSESDIQRVRDAGCEGAIIGKAIYEGRLTLGQALRAARG